MRQQCYGLYSQHCTDIAFALDQVALPMNRKLAVLDLGWAHMDAEYVRNLAASTLALAARHAFVAGLAQTGNQLTAQFNHRLDVNAVIYGLV